jgi:DNA-binding LacI/PurR family transcriptional regulator
MPRVGQRFRNVVGLVYPSHPVMPEFGSFESAMLGGVMKGLDADRYDLALIDIERDIAKDESYTQFFRRKGVRGVIIRPVSPEPTIAETIADEGFPCVMVADRTDHPNLGFVCSDSGRDSFRAIDHLIHLGHTRIAMVCHTMLDSDHRDRVSGYRRALKEHGIEHNPDIELFLPASMDGGTQAIDRLLSLEDPPTAIFVTNPVPTVGALHRCLELGIRVPDDISIIGFDDSDVRSRTYPKFSAICQNAEQFGYDAARWLTRRLEGTETGVLRIHRPTTLQFNKSTGPVPAKPVRLASNKSDIVRVEFPKRRKKK